MNIGAWFLGLIPQVSTEEAAIEKGMQYEADWALLEVKARLENNIELIAECEAVRKQWLSELVDEAGKVKTGLGKMIVEGQDPFSGSRKMMQAVLAKFPL